MAVGPSRASISGCEDACDNARWAGTARGGDHSLWTLFWALIPGSPPSRCWALTLQPVGCKRSVLLSEQSLKSAGKTAQPPAR